MFNRIRLRLMRFLLYGKQKSSYAISVLSIKTSLLFKAVTWLWLSLVLEGKVGQAPSTVNLSRQPDGWDFNSCRSNLAVLETFHHACPVIVTPVVFWGRKQECRHIIFAVGSHSCAYFRVVPFFKEAFAMSLLLPTDYLPLRSSISEVRVVSYISTF